MSSAIDESGQPGFRPSLRATTLCTPSAAMSVSVSNRRPSRAISSMRPSRRDACAMSAPLTSSAPASTASATSSASNSTRRIISAAGASDRTMIDAPFGPSRYRRDSACVAMRGSSRSRYGKRRSTRTLMPPPHGLLRGNTERSSRRTGTPAVARVRAAVAPAGPAPTTRIGTPPGGLTELPAKIHRKHQKRHIIGCASGPPVGCACGRAVGYC